MQATASLIQGVPETIVLGTTRVDSQVLWKHFQDRMKANADYEMDLTVLAGDLASRLPSHLSKPNFLRSLHITDMNQFLMSVMRAYSFQKAYSPGTVEVHGFDVTNQLPLPKSVREMAEAWKGAIMIDYELKGEQYIDISYYLDRKYY